MATIGTFTCTDSGLTGSVKTLTLNVKSVKFVPAEGDTDNGEQIVRRQLNIQPTLTIRPGFPVRVLVIPDLVMKPYGATKEPT